jgi:beta-lactamase class A
MTLGQKWLFVLNITLFAHQLRAASLHSDGLERDFARITARVGGRAGVCAADEAGQACLNAGQRFPMQSVMKLIAALAIADAVDSRTLKLDQPVTIRREDLSLNVQPIANIVNTQGSFRTTIGDLVRRAIVDSDSAATDILVRRLGGPRAVQAFLDRRGIRGGAFRPRRETSADRDRGNSMAAGVCR